MRYAFKNSYRLTQGFGQNPDAYKQFGLLAHNGNDHAVPCGTPLYAMITGKVIEAQNDPAGYGLYVKIENDAEGALVAHLSELAVKAGDSVIEGETYLGKSGTTGNSSGCHTHSGYYRIPRNRNNGFNGYIDQTDWLDRAIITQPIAQLTDQTIIDLGQYGKHEVQAIRGFYGDAENWKKDLKNAKKEIEKLETIVSRMTGELIVCQKDLKECLIKPTNPSNSPDSLTIKQLITALINKLYQ